jgi:hypothetical protein
MSGADRRMAGKRQLATRGKDAYPASMLRIRGREDESGLGVVELPRDPWHKLRWDLRRVGEDRELIATEHMIREDVAGEITGMEH